MSDFKYNPIVGTPAVNSLVTRRGWERPDWHRAVIGVHHVDPGNTWVVLGKCARDDRPHIVRLSELKGDWWLIEPMPPKPQVHKARAWLNRNSGRVTFNELGPNSGWVEVEFEVTEVQR